MKHVMKHDLPPEQAKKVAQKAFESYEERFADYNPSLTWTSDTHANASFKAKGLELKGAFELRPGEIEFDLEVPFILRPFRSKALDVMDRELRKWTEKAKAGEI